MSSNTFGTILFLLFFAVGLVLAAIFIVYLFRLMKSKNIYRAIAMIFTIISIGTIILTIGTGVPLEGPVASWVAPAIIACIVVPLCLWLLVFKNQD